MKRHPLFIVAILSLLIVSAMSLEAQTQNQETVIRVAGSDSMFYRVKLLGKLFAKTDPSVVIDVSQGGTMDSGIEAVINGQADLAMASCSITDKEEKLAVQKGVKLVEHLIGHGGIVIIANASAGTEQLTLDEMKKIFTGELTNWKQVGGADTPIRVVRTDETHPGTLAFLQRDLLHAPFTSQAIVVSTFPAIVATVADTPGTVGYVRLRELTESQVVRTNPKVKVVCLSRSKSVLPVYPDRDTVADQSYPLLRPYFIYHVANGKKTVLQFAEFLVKKGWRSQDL